MGTDKIKYIIFILIAFTVSLSAQSEYVPYSHPVYDFLERMEVLRIISGYNSFEKPQTRKKTAGYIMQVIKKKEELNSVDRGILEDLTNEFEYELNGTLNKSTSLIGGDDYNFFSSKEKYLYRMADSSRFTVFANLTGDVETAWIKNAEERTSASCAFLRWGGVIRGTILNRIGFYMKGTNGKFFGDKSAAGQINELKFNFKFNADAKKLTATDYFDNTEGYLSADYDIIRFKIGRDQMQIGYGNYKTFLDINTPQFDYLSFDVNYKALNFSWFHGKLLGSESTIFDPVQGEINQVASKYIGYHRIGINISDDFGFGLGEMIIYSNRPVDFSYLNPFNFYKGAEHANQDRDNSMLFLDLRNNTLRGLKLTASVLIDDIDFGKIGTGWYGNQLLYDINLHSVSLYNILPADMKLQYVRIEPFVYTHRIYDNSFSNLNYSLAAPLQPNSSILNASFTYRPQFRLALNAELTYILHGANELNSDGSIKRNTGGDSRIGYRIGDNPYVHFLDGTKEIRRAVSFSAQYEPVRNYFISGKLTYEWNNTAFSKSNTSAAGFVLLNLRI